MLAPQSPKGTRQGATAQRQQSAQSLVHGALARAGLGEGGNPAAKDGEQSVQQIGCHVSSQYVKHKWHKKKSLRAPAVKGSDSTGRLPRSVFLSADSFPATVSLAPSAPGGD